jgi:hypothetical protein
MSRTDNVTYDGPGQVSPPPVGQQPATAPAPASHQKPTKRRPTAVDIVKKIWIPLLILIVVAVAGFTVNRIRGFFGAEGVTVTPKVFADDPEPFDPKVVRYEITGNGSYADINYLDLDAKHQRVDGAALPWSLTLETTAPSAAPNIVAQGDGDFISCRVIVDDVVKDERTSSGVNAQTFCYVKSA